MFIERSRKKLTEEEVAALRSQLDKYFSAPPRWHGDYFTWDGTRWHRVSCGKWRRGLERIYNWLWEVWFGVKYWLRGLGRKIKR